MGVKVLLGKAETDSTKWNCNNLNSMLSNWASLVLIYLLPLFIPEAKFLTIGAIVLSIGEILMHLVLFNVKLKTFYNPGLITGLFGIGTVVIVYLIRSFDPSMSVNQRKSRPSALLHFSRGASLKSMHAPYDILARHYNTIYA